MGPDEPPKLDVLRAALDTSFRMHLGGGASLELQLVEVAERDRQPGWESFSLLFVGLGPPFEQAIYVLEHDVVGSIELFLVPLQSLGEQQRYEAVFNRPVA